MRSLPVGNALHRRTPLRILFVLAVSFLSVPLAFPQAFTSSITGVVRDPSGSAVANATVQLKNTGTNDVHTARSDDSGRYDVTNLLAGNYELTVTAPGFKTFVKSGLILQAQVAARVDADLQLGNTEQKIEVTGSSVLVDTETANNTVTLDSQLITSLPNSTRNPLNFVFAIAGTTQAPGGQTQTFGTLDQMSSNFGINGGRTGDEEILIDGAPSQAVDWGGLMVSPLQDSVAEQQILVNTYDAQYERGGAGIVTLITKGGTNGFHGEAYDYLQNSYLNANSWYNNEFGFPRGQFKQNQFGGNISGPLLKRWNLFFFGGYEGLRQPNTQSILTTVPTQAERAGDFSSALNADGTPNLIYNPFTTTALDNTGSNYTRTQFSGNVIPSGLINPVGQKIVNLYPLPNRPGEGPSQLNNYGATGSGDWLNDKFDTRVDWDQSSVHRLFVRFSDRVRQDQVYSCFFCNGADTGVNQYNNGFQAVINDTVTPNANWVINTYLSYSRWQEQHISQGYGVASASTIGLPNSDFQAPILPAINADNGFSSLGSGDFERYVRGSGTAQLNITSIIGSHTLKFGGNFDDQIINNESQSAGTFNFNSALTSCDPNPSGGPCQALNFSSSASGNAIASMLLGTASGGGQGINIDPAMALHTIGLYFQDRWHVNNRLTVSLGVRYENQLPATERYNRLMWFNENVINPIGDQISPAYGETLNQVFGHQLLGSFQYADNSPSKYAWPSNWGNIAPRLGIAYQVTHKLVARVGAGIFFLPPSAMISFDNPGEFYGYSSTTNYNATLNNGYTPSNLINNPFPQGITQPQGSNQGAYTLVGNGLGQIWPWAPHPTPYTEQWSFDMQYQLTPHSVFDVGYTGNKGRKLLYGNPNLDADQLNPQYLSLGSQLDAQVPNPFLGIADPSTYLGSAPTLAYNEMLRPFPQYTYLQWARSLPGARSFYNALNAKYNYQMSAGLNLLITYQWSKALDNAPEDNFGWATNNQWRDAYNTMLDYNISTHDVPQSFATSVVYDLPYGRGKKWGSNAPAAVKEVLGNWQVSSVITLQSGLPLYGLDLNGGNPLGNYGFPGPQLPDMVTFNVKPANQTPNNWVNPNAFTAPASAYELGNAPQRFTQLRARAERNVDFSIAKNFGGERFQAWLRGEAFNVFNYAQYNNVCLDLSNVNCAFGQAFGTQNQPRTLQLSLKLAF